MTEKNCKRCGAKLAGGGTLQGMCTTCLMELGLEEDSHVVITGLNEAPAPPPSPAELQPLFPNHQIEAVLGQGGMGVVYLATQKGLGRKVALKVLPAKAGRDPAFAERFAREARALASLNHPNITAVYDFGKAGEHYFLSMEFVDGVNLRQLLSAQKVATKQALQIVEQICDALQYAHDEGVVHRDIKPENILLDRRGNLKITDFGLAKMLGREEDGPTGLTMTHQVMGTPHYMAPEQVEKPTEVDHRADIYSLGVVFYELLTGELPLGRFAPPSGKVQVDVKLDEVVLRTLEKEPSMRYQTANAVKSDVSHIDLAATMGAAASAAVGAAAGGGAAGRAASPSPASTPDPAYSASIGGHDSARGHRGRNWSKILLLGCLLPMVCLGGCFLIMVPMGYQRAQAEVATQQAMAHEEIARQHAADLNAQEEATRRRDEAIAAKLGRLEGLDLFDKLSDGTLELSLPFREVYQIREEVAVELAKSMLEVSRDYRRERERRTRYEVLEPRAGQVTIDAFPEVDETLGNRFLRKARALLSNEAFEAIVTRDPMHTEIVTDARKEVRHEIRYDSQGYTWRSFADGVIFDQGREEQLPRELDDHWRHMYEQLGPSAVPALQEFLAVLDSLASDETEIEIQSIRVERPRSPRYRNAGRAPVTLEVDAFFHAASVQKAAELLEVFKQTTRNETGAEVLITRAESYSGKEGAGAEAKSVQGLSVKNMDIVFSVPNPPVLLPQYLEPQELTGLLRTMAHEATGIGLIDIKTSTNSRDTRFMSKVHSLSIEDPVPEQPRTLAQIAAFLSEVEAVNDHSTVNDYHLSRMKGIGWRAMVEVETREAR